ncbi:MAG TPA: hypothetical protein VM286_00585 [Candidatus Thermoplasmatota archaeon]|nr:hypothetical protein [Candidatus Thermoplasmatota archaeon]
MALADELGVFFRYREALVAGLLVSIAVALSSAPHIIRRLKVAGIAGGDRHKLQPTQVAEMGGLIVFLAFNVGAFFVMAFGSPRFDGPTVFASLIVITGATIAGILDDLISLRQALKALISFAFAIPLALFVNDYHLFLPFLGHINLGLAYPLLLVPLAVASAANSFNMLEGFNGIASSLGLINALFLSILAGLSGNITGLVILVPLAGALIGFRVYNHYPAKVFPGDTGTLLIGAALACGAILSKLEIWAGLLLIPHIVEFIIKAKGHFKVQSFAERVDENGGLHYTSKVRSIPHLVMRARPGITEYNLVRVLMTGQIVLGILVIGLYKVST